MSKNAKSAIIFIIAAIIIIVALVLTVGSKKPATPVDNTTQATSTQPIATSTAPIATTTATYTMAQVALHATKTDCWTAVNGSVYELTAFIPKHPGGDKIVAICGKDGSALFTNTHGGQPNPEKALASQKIGTLVK